MKHLNEYRYFKVRKSYWNENEKDPNEPFFNIPKRKYKKQKREKENKERCYSRHKKFTENFDTMKPVLEECYELLKNREIDKIGKGIMLSNGRVLSLICDDSEEHWDLFLDHERVGECDIEYNFDWENNGCYNNECNELVMNILNEMFEVFDEEREKQAWRKYEK